MTFVFDPEAPTQHHVPVMLNEVLALLAVEPQKGYADGTLGAGGHSSAILQALEGTGRYIGFDRDASALAYCRHRFESSLSPHWQKGIEENRYHLINRSFDTLAAQLTKERRPRLDGGILVDFGVASFHFDQAERGFSFQKDAPLDMRLDHCLEGNVEIPTAAELLATASEARLTEIFSNYGEERLSKTIARRIVQERKTSPLTTTLQLAELVKAVYAEKGIVQGKAGKMGSGKKSRNVIQVHPATCVFQALRIAVNDELGHIERFLSQLPDCLAPGARVVCISFHSLEDRLVKRAFQQWANPSANRLDWNSPQPPKRANKLTPKPILPSAEECAQNPRARSAKVRAIEWLG